MGTFSYNNWQSKIISSLLVFVLIANSVFLVLIYHRQAKAFLGIGDIVSDPMHTLSTIGGWLKDAAFWMADKIADAAKFVAEKAQWLWEKTQKIREWLWEKTKWLARKIWDSVQLRLLDFITNSTIWFIQNTGRGGEGIIPDNWQDFFWKQQDAAVEGFLTDITHTDFCEQIGPTLHIKTALTANFGRTSYFGKEARCPGNVKIANAEAFFDNFEGGWENWLKLYEDPRGNIYTNTLLALEAGIQEEEGKVAEAKGKLEAGGGFLGQERCLEFANQTKKVRLKLKPNTSTGEINWVTWVDSRNTIEIPTPEGATTRESIKNYLCDLDSDHFYMAPQLDPEAWETTPANQKIKTCKHMVDKNKVNNIIFGAATSSTPEDILSTYGFSCQKWETLTPGKSLGEMTTKALTSKTDWITQSEEIGPRVEAIVNAAFNRLFEEGAYGLKHYQVGNKVTSWFNKTLFGGWVCDNQGGENHQSRFRKKEDCQGACQGTCRLVKNLSKPYICKGGKDNGIRYETKADCDRDTCNTRGGTCQLQETTEPTNPAEDIVTGEDEKARTEGLSYQDAQSGKVAQEVARQTEERQKYEAIKLENLQGSPIEKLLFVLEKLKKALDKDLLPQMQTLKDTQDEKIIEWQKKALLSLLNYHSVKNLYLSQLYGGSDLDIKDECKADSTIESYYNTDYSERYQSDGTKNPDVKTGSHGSTTKAYISSEQIHLKAPGIGKIDNTNGKGVYVWYSQIGAKNSIHLKVNKEEPYYYSIFHWFDDYSQTIHVKTNTTPEKRTKIEAELTAIENWKDKIIALISDIETEEIINGTNYTFLNAKQGVADLIDYARTTNSPQGTEICTVEKQGLERLRSIVINSASITSDNYKDILPELKKDKYPHQQELRNCLVAEDKPCTDLKQKAQETYRTGLKQAGALVGIKSEFSSAPGKGGTPLNNDDEIGIFEEKLLPGNPRVDETKINFLKEFIGIDRSNVRIKEAAEGKGDEIGFVERLQNITVPDDNENLQNRLDLEKNTADSMENLAEDINNALTAVKQTSEEMESGFQAQTGKGLENISGYGKLLSFLVDVYNQAHNWSVNCYGAM